MQDAERHGSAAAGAPDVELEQLREELAKWRTRVPRLVSALRQRTEELESLRLRAAAAAKDGVGAGTRGEMSVGGDAGIRQRDALIAELEARVEALDRDWRGAQGELHACRLERDELREQVGSWKRKWQEATQSLDDHGRRLAETSDERDRLSERNAQLLETTELATRQIESLGQSVEALRGQVRQSGLRELDLGHRLEDANAENAGLGSRLEALAAEADDLIGFAQTLCASAAVSVHDVQAANRRLQDLRREKDAQLLSLRQRAEQAEEALRRAERAIDENSRYVTQLDDRLERQKTLLAQLEEELAEAQTRRADEATLAARLQELEEELTLMSMQRDGDDLTLIRGVGPKLARQLNAMGIFRLEQIAELDPQSLADDAHLLHAHKGRILRDGWIEQAARLVSH